MSLYEDWAKCAYDKDGMAIKKLWDEYLPLEQKIYQNILSEKNGHISGTIEELSRRFNLTQECVCGFLDGINESLTEPVKLEDLEPESNVEINIEFEKLYKKMVEYKASHLYTLPEWDNIYTPEHRKELYMEQKKSGTMVKGEKIGRNELCPCGSGKKYKKCCGVN